MRPVRGERRGVSIAEIVDDVAIEVERGDARRGDADAPRGGHLVSNAMQLLLEIALAFGEVPFARRARGFLLRGVEFGIARLELCLEPRDFAVQGVLAR